MNYIPLAWLGLAWLGLAWLGLAWLVTSSTHKVSHSKIFQTKANLCRSKLKKLQSLFNEFPYGLRGMDFV
jgi:hypothetical protein